MSQHVCSIERYRLLRVDCNFTSCYITLKLLEVSTSSVFSFTWFLFVLQVIAAMMYKASRLLTAEDGQRMVTMAKGLALNAKWDAALRVYGVSSEISIFLTDTQVSL